MLEIICRGKEANALFIPRSNISCRLFTHFLCHALQVSSSPSFLNHPFFKIFQSFFFCSHCCFQHHHQQHYHRNNRLHHHHHSSSSQSPAETFNLLPEPCINSHDRVQNFFHDIHCLQYKIIKCLSQVLNNAEIVRSRMEGW